MENKIFYKIKFLLFISIFLSGNTAYFGNDGYLEKADITKPENPVELIKILDYMEGIAISGNYAYVADRSDGLFILRNDLITGVNDNNGNLPDAFSLRQNYPNPFNPTTTIKYDLPKEVHVTLRVYNILGQEVATLVNGVKQAGSYEATFDASNMSSGIYYYSLKAGQNVLTKKMILLK